MIPIRFAKAPLVKGERATKWRGDSCCCIMNPSTANAVPLPLTREADKSPTNSNLFTSSNPPNKKRRCVSTTSFALLFYAVLALSFLEVIFCIRTTRTISARPILSVATPGIIIQSPPARASILSTQDMCLNIYPSIPAERM